MLHVALLKRTLHCVILDRCKPEGYPLHAAEHSLRAGKQAAIKCDVIIAHGKS